MSILEALQSSLDALLQLIGVSAEFTHLLAHGLNLQHLRQKVYFLCHKLQIAVELSRLTENSLSTRVTKLLVSLSCFIKVCVKVAVNSYRISI